MPRTARKKSKTGIYHIMLRGISIGAGSIEFGPVLSDWIPIQKDDVYDSDFSWYNNDAVIDYGFVCFLMQSIK